MQVPQLYRRGVVRPLDDAAATQLKNWDVETSIRTEWLPVLSDEHFAMIWESGIFQRINEACGSTISDYEEVVLTVSQLNAALNVLNGMPLPNTADVSVFVQNLKAVMSQAIEAKTPLYFIF